MPIAAAAVVVAAGSSLVTWAEETLYPVLSARDGVPRVVGFFLPLLPKPSHPYLRNS